MKIGFAKAALAGGVVLAAAGAAQAQCFVCSDAGYNTSVGSSALRINTGQYNSAFGDSALYSNLGGSNNTATGDLSLFANTGGNNNTAFGYEALTHNTTGSGNAAQGFGALGANLSGDHNVAVGNFALNNLDAGSGNIGVGYRAASNVKSGNNDIDIGNPGGTSTESGVIRIGTLGTHTFAYIQGIAGQTLSTSSPAAVYVDPATGQLGKIASSERFKTDVSTMGDASGRIGDLRPVSFRLKTDPQGPVQYGLIAEEVAAIYPELVLRGEDGRIDGVRYEELTPLLLNEVQRLHAQLAAIQAQLARMQDLERRMTALQRRQDPPTRLEN